MRYFCASTYIWVHSPPPPRGEGDFMLLFLRKLFHMIVAGNEQRADKKRCNIVVNGTDSVLEIFRFENYLNENISQSLDVEIIVYP